MTMQHAILCLACTGVCVVGVGAGAGTVGGGVLPVRRAAEGEGEVGIETGTETGGEGGVKGRRKETTRVEAEEEGGPDLQG